MDYGLAGRTVVVTGGASGIGRAVSELAAANGASVAVFDRNEESIATTVEALQVLGAKSSGHVVDVRDYEAVVAALADAEAGLGKVQGVVAAAGISKPALARDLSPQQFAETIDVNLIGVFNIAKAAGDSMLEQGSGAFVAIGSTDSFGGHVHRAHYSASKHAVVGLVKSLAIEWGPHGVRANVVAPGVVDTPLLRSIHSPDSIQETFLNKVPMGRLAAGADQANAALFLLSDGAAFISGAVLPVDGGLTSGYFNRFPIPAL